MKNKVKFSILLEVNIDDYLPLKKSIIQCKKQLKDGFRQSLVLYDKNNVEYIIPIKVNKICQ